MVDRRIACLLAGLVAFAACTSEDPKTSGTTPKTEVKNETQKGDGKMIENALPMTTELQKGDIGSIKVQTTKNGFWFTGQPSKDDFAEAAKRGMKTVVNFRTKGEIEWDEGPVVEKLGMKYVHLPFRKIEDLTDEFFAKARAAIQAAEKPAMLQCGSSNRVGAIWFTSLVLDQGMDEAAAIAEAKKAGLRSPALLERVKADVASKR